MWVSVSHKLPLIYFCLGPALAPFQVLRWGRGFGRWKTSDHQVNCTQVAPDSSARLYLYLNRVFFPQGYVNSFIIGFHF